MAFGKRRRRAEEGVNPVPLVDVMFNLLIFIIVTAQYSHYTSLKVNLPKASSGTVLEKSDNLVIAVTKEEQLFLNNQLVTQEALQAALAKAASQKNQPFVLIQADEGTTTGRLVGLMDLASKTGLTKLSIETRK